MRPDRATEQRTIVDAKRRICAGAAPSCAAQPARRGGVTRRRAGASHGDVPKRRIRAGGASSWRLNATAWPAMGDPGSIRQPQQCAPTWRSAEAARWLGELLWVSSHPKPNFSHSLRVLAGQHPRSSSSARSQDHRADDGPNEQMTAAERPRGHYDPLEGIAMTGKHPMTR